MNHIPPKTFKSPDSLWCVLHQKLLIIKWHTCFFPNKKLQKEIFGFFIL